MSKRNTGRCSFCGGPLITENTTRLKCPSCLSAIEQDQVKWLQSHLATARQTNRNLNRRIQELESVKAKQDAFASWREQVLKQAALLSAHRINEVFRVDQLWHQRYYDACEQVIAAGVDDSVDGEFTGVYKTRHLDELIRRLVAQRDEEIRAKKEIEQELQAVKREQTEAVEIKSLRDIWKLFTDRL